jgi:type VI protein secretion system component Hcp
MAGNETGDLLMMVLSDKRIAIPGESSSQTNMRNPLMAGMHAKNMFEITGFSFGVKTIKDDPATAAARTYAALAQGLQTVGNQSRIRLPAPRLITNLSKEQNSQKDKQAEVKSCPIDEVHFDRPIDKASNTLMQYCIDCKTLHGAVVVKLKPAGGKSAGEAYLRFEFIDILFIAMAWNNGEPIEEHCTFITRAVKVMYRPQLPDGTLGAVVSGAWSSDAAKRQELKYPL